jgi:hypothetical protein
MLRVCSLYISIVLGILSFDSVARSTQAPDDRQSARGLSGASSPGHTLRMLPGLQHDGSTLLPNQWSLRPAGKQIELGDFPVNIAVQSRRTLACGTPCRFRSA